MRTVPTALRLPADAEINWLTAEQSNSSLIIGDALMLKMFRRISGGPHPEVEMGRYLTRRGFANSPALLGEVVRVDPDGTRSSLAVAQRFVRNQGDAWTWLVDHLIRGLDDLAASAEPPASAGDHIADYDALAAIIGRRLGEMHAVLGAPTGEPGFAPVRASAADVAQWAERVRGATRRGDRPLGQAGLGAGRGPRPRRDAGAAIEAPSLGLLDALARSGEGSLMCRVHGDFHLGQVLVASGDVYIIDFEGEPARPLARAARQDEPVARRRRPAALVRLCGRSGDRTATQSASPGDQRAARRFRSRAFAPPLPRPS